MDEGLGFKFWLWLAAIIIGGGIALLIGFLIFSRAVYAWGIFGAMIVIGGILLLFGWFWDKREVRRYEEGEA